MLEVVVVKPNRTLILLFAAASLGVVQAAALTKEELAATLQSVEASDIRESPIAGVLEVAVGSEVAYITEDGRFLMQGELYDLEIIEGFVCPMAVPPHSAEAAGLITFARQ